MKPADAWPRDFEPSACPFCERENCEGECRPSEAQTPPADPDRGTPPKLAAMRALDILAATAPVEIVEGIAWAGCVSVLVSESGAGKTFVLLDVAAAVSAELPWHGRATVKGSVVYLGFEGDALGLRLRALHDVQGHHLEHVYIIRARDPLSPRVRHDGEDRSPGELAAVDALEKLSADLAAANRPPVVLVIIDTVRASMTGSEDSSEHVSAYLRAVRRIQMTLPNAALILAHHAGWQDGDNARKRERGSSAFRGNCDATLYLEAGAGSLLKVGADGAVARREAGEAALTLRTLKARDAERAAPLHLVRRRVELPGERDRHGQPVTSCVIERDRRSREDREAERLAALEAEACKVDLVVLRAMRDYPEATSITKLQSYVGVRTATVSEAVSRILRAHLALKGKPGQPFTLTEAGRARLTESQP